jgi:hypothetical protein
MRNIAYYVFSIAAISHTYLLCCSLYFCTIDLDSVWRIRITLMWNRLWIWLFNSIGIQIQLFTLMRIRIRLPKMMLVYADPYPQHC